MQVQKKKNIEAALSDPSFRKQMEQRLEAFPSNTKPSEQAGAPMIPSKFQKRPLKIHDTKSDLPGVKNTTEGSLNTTVYFKAAVKL